MDKTVYILEDRKIRVEWTILKGTSPVREDFRRALVKVFLIGNCEKYLLEATADRGTLMIDIPEGLEPGLYSLEAIWVKNAGHPGRHDRDLCRSMKQDLFAITEFEEEATNLPEGTVVLRAKSSTATYGYDGLSSYELAVLRGEWNGTEGEWLKHQRYVSVLEGRGDSEVDTMSQKSITEELVKHDTALEDTNKEIDTVQTDIKNLGTEMKEVQDRLNYIPKESFLSSEPACDYHTEDNQDELTVSRAIKDRFGRIIDEHYVTRETVKDYTQEVVDGSKLEIQPGSVQPEDLSPAVQQMIESAAAQPGHITNLPDEEDLTVTEHNTLQFKDREYNPYNYSGMGKVYLRKHIVNGTNMLTQHMMRKPNTIYVIRYDYCLGGETIEVPEGCVLEFDGGSLRNGKIVGHNTKIAGILNKIFKNSISIDGIWNIATISTNYFDNLDYTNSLKNVFNLSNPDITNTIYVEDKGSNYILDITANNTAAIELNSNTNLLINATLKLIGNRFAQYQIIKINNCDNVKISGYGKIIGDKNEHIGLSGEWGFGISILNSNNIAITGLTINSCWGDSIYVGLNCGDIDISFCKLNESRRQGISIITGNNISINNCTITNIGGTDPGAGIDVEPNADNIVNNVYVYNNFIKDCTYGVQFVGFANNAKVNYAHCYNNTIVSSESMKTGIAAETVGEIFIENNIVNNCLYYLVMCARSKRIVLKDNILTTTLAAPEFRSCISLVNNEDNIVKGNRVISEKPIFHVLKDLIIDNNYLEGSRMTYFYYTSRKCENTILRNNTIVSNLDLLCVNTTIENNHFYIPQYGYAFRNNNDNTANVLVTNNVFETALDLPSSSMITFDCNAIVKNNSIINKHSEILNGIRFTNDVIESDTSFIGSFTNKIVFENTVSYHNGQLKNSSENLFVYLNGFKKIITTNNLYSVTTDLDKLSENRDLVCLSIYSRNTTNAPTTTAGMCVQYCRVAGDGERLISQNCFSYDFKWYHRTLVAKSDGSISNYEPWRIITSTPVV